MAAFLIYLVLLVLSLAALGLNVFSLPGNWLMAAMAALVSAIHGGTKPSLAALLLIVILLLCAEILELLAGLVGARKFGASRTAGIAAILGAMGGAIVGLPVPYIGSLLGAIAGAFVAAWAAELLRKQPLQVAMKAATGAALGRAAGMITKLVAGMLAWLCLAIAAWPW